MVNKNINDEGKYKKQPINVSKHANLSLYFPETPNLDKLKITNVGIYSVSKPKMAEWISQKIKENLDTNSKNLIITDANAGVGGNVINFAKYFKKVNAIENDKIHFDVLKNNINVYNLKNVTAIFGDVINIIPQITQDIIFFDPPWGGKNYKKDKNIILKLSNISLKKYISNILPKVKLIAIKVPYNFDFGEFFDCFNKVIVYMEGKARLLIIKN